MTRPGDPPEQARQRAETHRRLVAEAREVLAELDEAMQWRLETDTGVTPDPPAPRGGS